MSLDTSLNAGRVRCPECGQFCNTYVSVNSRSSAGMPDIEQSRTFTCTCGHHEHLPLEPNGLVTA